MAAKTPILDLTTITDRPRIKIDDALYDLARPSDLGLRDDAKLARMQNRANELYQKTSSDEELTDDEWGELSQLLDQACRLLILDLPDDKHALLTDIQRIQIMSAFTMATRPKTEKTPKTSTPPKENPRTSAKSSRASSTSTKATPNAG